MKSSPCPYTAFCVTPDACAERRSCVLGTPRPATRAGWENEPIAPPIPWKFYAFVVACTVAVSALMSGCGGNGDDTEPTSGTQPVDCVACPELCK